MKRWICFFATLLLLSSLLCVPVAAEVRQGIVLYDKGGLFEDKSDRLAVEASIWNAWGRVDCEFYVATHRSLTNAYTGEDFLRAYGLSANQNIVLLVITLDGGAYFYDVYTYGEANSRIRDAEINYILDHEDVISNLKRGRLVEGVDAFMRLSASAYEGRVGVSYAIIGTISLIIALIIGTVACVSVHASYKMKKKSVDYPLDRFAKLELRGQSDVFTGSFVTKRVIQTNNGGRGGSSHGGGGGHRGGR